MSRYILFVVLLGSHDHSGAEMFIKAFKYLAEAIDYGINIYKNLYNGEEYIKLLNKFGGSATGYEILDIKTGKIVYTQEICLRIK